MEAMQLISRLCMLLFANAVVRWNAAWGLNNYVYGRGAAQVSSIEAALSKSTGKESVGELKAMMDVALKGKEGRPFTA